MTHRENVYKLFDFFYYNHDAVLYLRRISERVQATHEYQLDRLIIPDQVDIDRRVIIASASLFNDSISVLASIFAE